jgi:hypothetical protein
VSVVKQFKIVVIYLVKAEDRSQALELFATAKQAHRENDYFETQTVKEVDATGWKATVGKQLFGR